MKLIIFTTCKPFIGDDAWRQEQAIRSWTLLEGIEKKIIIIGNDYGTKEICDKYNLIHEPIIRNLNGIPYLHSMFEIANKYADDNDVMLWTNSDMIYYNSMITCIKYFKTYGVSIKNYLLVGSRIDWANPKVLDDLSFEHFNNNINLNEGVNVNICKTNSDKYECYYHKPCGIDYVIHSKSTFINNIDKNLVIAGTRHDMIMVGVGITNNFFTCDITNVCPVIHQNHGIVHSQKININKQNNLLCRGSQASITDTRYKMINNNTLCIVKRI
tara:strand:- start:117 stop:929 length:813 start_codon:yes stop_codon:yes gene_type:complete